jgi:hypothetical protein
MLEQTRNRLGDGVDMALQLLCVDVGRAIGLWKIITIEDRLTAEIGAIREMPASEEEISNIELASPKAIADQFVFHRWKTDDPLEAENLFR